MYFEELNGDFSAGDFSAGLWRKNPNGRKDIHHGRHHRGGGVEFTPDANAERRSPLTDDFLAFVSKTGKGDAFTVGFVVVCVCVSFVLVVSAVAVVQLHLKTKNSKDGEEEEEEEALLDGCERGSTVRNRTGARRKKKKRKKDDESSSSLYGAIV
ncbi:unnamed protein product [Bathycoccus prasinos]